MSTAQLHPLGYESKVAHLSTGHYYRYVDIHPPKGVETIVTALVLHGFPDSAYGWRHQIKGWSERGIRLIIPDTLGYNGSSQPTNPEDYAMKRQSDDLEELVHQTGISKDEKIIVIAHDWGAGIANRLVLFKPDLVKGAANLCVPFAPPTPQYIPMEKYIELLPNFQYQAFFASPESTSIVDANVDRFMRLVYASAKQGAAGEVPSFEKTGVIEAWLKDEANTVMPELLSQQEFDTMVSEIKAGVGFGAMLNYYRTREINYELEKDLPQDMRPDMPKLMVVPSADPAIPAALSVRAEKQLKNIEVVWLEGLCGHWVQLERPQEIEKIVGEWVERFTKKGWAT
ncbi:unnamed protein product [Rhizoctonia solani]|uniref:AB hydrolase-1 domain-containing protein n=3 Tax=Rhizoctonia solani TaxID=456999 RepID=A0A8H3AHZ1_9AGAM|nr:alpha/beta hydrolase family containing protein [Rhizoctonia solani AG-3 Rhs1AP]KEP55829.1 alpha/beta hydrolase family containing protein [Rhizoctonia solani 123E]CAE6419337.1 unnamed protein product [Rhizoctonia solani]CAE6526234.1 unnamed protein product [Rhizoctonia solani]